MDALGAVITFIVGVGGVTLGAILARRNDRRAQAERLLVEALNDAVQAIASVAGGAGPEAQRHYASAVSRVALHGSPAVIAALRTFQDDATTLTAEGRTRLIAVVRAARAELGHRPADEDDLGVLLFGSGPVNVEQWARAEEAVRESVDAIAAGEPEPRAAPGEDGEVDRLAELTETAPAEAVQGAFALVRRELERIAGQAGLPRGARMPTAALADTLARAGLINRETLSAVRGLAALRDMAAHVGRDPDVTMARAREYVALVRGVLFALSRAPGGGEDPPATGPSSAP